MHRSNHTSLIFEDGTVLWNGCFDEVRSIEVAFLLPFVGWMLSQYLLGPPEKAAAPDVKETGTWKAPDLIVTCSSCYFTLYLHRLMSFRIMGFYHIHCLQVSLTRSSLSPSSDKSADTATGRPEP